MAVLEAFDGAVESLRFQKYLFLILNRINNKYYSFVPYKYGSFSFESYNDRRNLIRLNYLVDNENKWILHKNTNFLSEMNLLDQKAIFTIKKKYEKISKAKLLHELYSDYPYYAINSQIKSKANLNHEEKISILNNQPSQKEKCLFTIGYEGRSIDAYINLLIKNNIKILCDVRKNPLSRKYGFTKQSLKKITSSLGIKYVHIPELGIDSKLRKNLNTRKDYQKLFASYKTSLLPSNKEALNTIMSLINAQKRVALTCFEFESDLCHRHCISSALQKEKTNLKIKHI